MRKILAVAAIAALALTGCGRADDTTTGASGSASASVNPADITVGVAMPTKTSERWIKDGDYMKQQLEAAGYKVNLQYANDDIPTQVTQLQDMITKKNDVLVVASIDGTALKGALADAKADGIPVIAYDRLLRDTDAVEYYTTFDNLKVGKLQAESLLEGPRGLGQAQAVERRAVRRVPRRQQRDLLLQRRLGRAQAEGRRRHHQDQVR